MIVSQFDLMVWIFCFSFNYLFIKNCDSSNLSQNKLLVIYWDLRSLYNTWNWLHSPVIIPPNLTYGTSAYIFRHLLCYFTNMLAFWLSMLLLSFLIFMSNVSIINDFYHIFVSEVIFKTRIIKTKHTGTTLLNLTLLPSCNYLRGFILFDNNASWHWTMACRHWEFQWVLPVSSCKD